MTSGALTSPAGRFPKIMERWRAEKGRKDWIEPKGISKQSKAEHRSFAFPVLKESLNYYFGISRKSGESGHSCQNGLEVATKFSSNFVAGIILPALLFAALRP